MTVRHQLDVDVDELGAVSRAAQFRQGPVFLVGRGACIRAPHASDVLARGFGEANPSTRRLTDWPTVWAWQPGAHDSEPYASH